MSSLFRPLSIFRGAPPVDVDAALPAYLSTAARAGEWLAPGGAPGRGGLSSEDLDTVEWSLAWESPLDDAAAPDSILAGGGYVVVNGREFRGIWSADGARKGTIRRGGSRASFLELRGARLLADKASGGLWTHRLPSGKSDARILLAKPSVKTTYEWLEGPGVHALVTASELPFSPMQSVVQTVRIEDHNRSSSSIHYGIKPLAGIVREGDGRICAAAATAGPVLATSEGLSWCAWGLTTLHEYRGELTPLRLSVDEAGTAYLLHARDRVAWLSIIPPGGPPSFDRALPWPADFDDQAPLLAPKSNFVGLVHRGHFLALTLRGEELWSKSEGAITAATLTAGGVVLLARKYLYAVQPNGEQQVLWTSPEPLLAPPILTGGRIYAAGEDHLFALEKRSLF